MDGYNRKKCVAKILYMYVLGYEPDFGYAEALRLLSSKKFSEKQMVRKEERRRQSMQNLPTKLLIYRPSKTDFSARLTGVICFSVTLACFLPPIGLPHAECSA